MRKILHQCRSHALTGWNIFGKHAEHIASGTDIGDRLGPLSALFDAADKRDTISLTPIPAPNSAELIRMVLAYDCKHAQDTVLLCFDILGLVRTQQVCVSSVSVSYHVCMYTK